MAELRDAISCSHALGFPGVGKPACIRIHCKISNMYFVDLVSNAIFLTLFSFKEGNHFCSKMTTTTSCNRESEMTLQAVVKLLYLITNLALSVF